MEEKALDKIDIASELKTLSPIEAKSLELKKQAEAAEITDKSSYTEAKKLKKALISHRTGTKDLRLTFTRKLDNLKDQFIKKQDEVLEASLAGEEIIKEKVSAWEKLEQERKDAEEKRVQAILDKFKSMTPPDMKTGTPEDVKRFRAAIKMERGLLEPRDRNKVAVKTLLEDIETEVDAIEGFINERIAQEQEREELQKQRVKLHSEQLEAIGFPLNEVIYGFRISGLDLTKNDEEWQPIYEQAKKRLAMQAEKESKPADAPIDTGYPKPSTNSVAGVINKVHDIVNDTPVDESAKESSEPAKESGKKKFILTFTTTIRGQVTVEADTKEEAETEGEELAQSTLNYDELTDQGRHAPDVETEFDDIYEPKEEE